MEYIISVILTIILPGYLVISPQKCAGNYLADKYGLHAIGYNAEPSPVLHNRIKNALREYLARVKMFIDLIK